MVKRIRKRHFICYVIAQSNESLTRYEILERVHMLEGNKRQFVKTHNNCYFQPNAEAYGQTHARASVVMQGYVYPKTKRGNSIIYGLTDKGRALVEEYVEWAKMS